VGQKRRRAVARCPTDLNVRELATAMNAACTPALSPSPQSSCRRKKAFAWSIFGTSTASCWAFAFHLADNSIESIFDLCEAVDWIEREIHEGFASTLLGREYEPLLLRQGDNAGVNLREEVV
jgi:hypothetical protein